MLMELKSGTVKIALRDDLAPNHVERIKQLITEKFYDGVVFHRVIDGFMAQTGDPTGTGMGGSDYPDLRAEFTSEPFQRGILSNLIEFCLHNLPESSRIYSNILNDTKL